MEIRNLCKTYGEKKVLSSFCADFQPGKRYALMGPSGIGKTTLVRLILGLEKPDSGDMTGIPAKMSAVFQENRLIPELTIPGNLRFILGRRFPAETIREMLEALSLTVWKLPQPGSPAASSAGPLWPGLCWQMLSFWFWMNPLRDWTKKTSPGPSGKSPAVSPAPCCW